MHGHWPPYAKQAWRALKEQERDRSRKVYECIQLRHGGFVVGQKDLFVDLKKHYRLGTGTAHRAVARLVELNLLRKRLYRGQAVIWVPEHLLDAAVDPKDEELFPPFHLPVAARRRSRRRVLGRRRRAVRGRRDRTARHRR